MISTDQQMRCAVRPQAAAFEQNLPSDERAISSDQEKLLGADAMALAGGQILTKAERVSSTAEQNLFSGEGPDNQRWTRIHHRSKRGLDWWTTFDHRRAKFAGRRGKSGQR